MIQHNSKNVNKTQQNFWLIISENYSKMKMSKEVKEMLTDSRQNMIKKIAARDGEVIISKVAKELGVSLETVRRDINALCAENVLQKVHGGAVPLKKAVYEDSYSRRKDTGFEVKAALGEYTARLISSSSLVFFAPGTTAEAVANATASLGSMAIITNSLPIAEVFGKYSTEKSGVSNVTLLGGTLNPTEHVTFGAETKAEVSRYRADTAVIGAVGVGENGVMCSSVDEGSIIESMVENSGRTVLVATSEKLSQTSVYKVTGLEKISDCVTDNRNPVPEALKKAFNKHGVRLHIVAI